jgi:hypothetical protein
MTCGPVGAHPDTLGGGGGGASISRKLEIWWSVGAKGMEVRDRKDTSCPFQFKGRLVYQMVLCHFVPDRCVPERKVSDVLGRCVPVRPLLVRGETYNICISNQFQTLLFNWGGGGPVGVTDLTIG